MLAPAVCQELAQLEVTGRLVDRINDTVPDLLDGRVVHLLAVQSGKDSETFGVPTFGSEPSRGFGEAEDPEEEKPRN
jgi:hypothetical protein